MSFEVVTIEQINNTRVPKTEVMQGRVSASVAHWIQSLAISQGIKTSTMVSLLLEDYFHAVDGKNARIRVKVRQEASKQMLITPQAQPEEDDQQFIS